LHTPPVRRYALKQLVQILGRQGLDFDASEVSYNLLTLQATLGHVTVRSRQTPDLPPLAKADRIYVDLDLRKLLSGEIYVEDAALTNPSIHIVVDEQGRDNLPHSKDESTSETNYLIDKFQATGGSVDFEDRRQQIHAVIPRFELDIDGNPSTREHLIRLQTKQDGTVSFQQRSMPLREIMAEVLLQKNAIDIHSLQIALRDSTVNLAGKIDNFKDPRYDFKGETDLGLGSFAEFAGVQQKVNGTVHLSLTAKGPLAQTVVTARVDGQNISIEGFEKLNLKADTAYEAAPSAFRSARSMCSRRSAGSRAKPVSR